MKPDESEKHPEITGKRVKQIPKFENLDDEFAEQVATTLKKLTSIIYSSIARELSLNPMSETDLPDPNEKPKRTKKAKVGS